MEIANRYIASCGNDCTRCPQYENSCVEGCLGDPCANYCSTCTVRLCSRDHKTANCAHCEKYPCQKLEEQYENMAQGGFGEWAMSARKVLEEIQHTLKFSSH